MFGRLHCMRRHGYPDVRQRNILGDPEPSGLGRRLIMKRVLACAGLMLAVLIGGASQPATGQPAAGKTLIMALDQSDVKTLDPGREFEFGAAFVRSEEHTSELQSLRQLVCRL